MAAVMNTLVARSAFTGRALRSATRAAAPARSSVVTSAAARNVWYPGNEPPAWLDGSLPGDYGFDPLGLGSDPEILKWMVQGELQNARWAMLGAAGIMVTDLGRVTGALDVPVWFQAGATSSGAFEPLTGALVTLVLMGWAEGRRWADIVKPGSTNVDPIFGYKLSGTDVGYPGFDPAGMGKGSADAVKTIRQKEIINGRLAMVACVGFAVQSWATGAGPMENLFKHLADPGANTVFSF